MPEEHDSPAPRTAAACYRQALAETGPSCGAARTPAAGRWDPDPGVSPEQLAAALAKAETDASSSVIKSTPRITVFRAALLGRDVLVKRYDLAGIGDALKYLCRPSRARRASAAARAFQALGIPTPQPLGFLEIRSGPLARRSYALTEFVSDAVPAQQWIPGQFLKASAPAREKLRRELLDLLLDLYRKGVYHADTKAHNLLVRHPEDPAQRSFLWIDLECVRFGARPSRRQVVRNLVQLNGSLRSKVDIEERRAFLQDLARHYPWAADPRVEQRIRRWTERRLRKERVERCGS